MVATNPGVQGSGNVRHLQEVAQASRTSRLLASGVGEGRNIVHMGKCRCKGPRSPLGDGPTPALE